MPPRCRRRRSRANPRGDGVHKSSSTDSAMRLMEMELRAAAAVGRADGVGAGPTVAPGEGTQMGQGAPGRRRPAARRGLHRPWGSPKHARAIEASLPVPADMEPPVLRRGTGAGQPDWAAGLNLRQVSEDPGWDAAWTEPAFKAPRDPSGRQMTLTFCSEQGGGRLSKFFARSFRR